MQEKLVAGDRWIIDGDLGRYDSVEIRLRAADTIIFLDFSFVRCGLASNSPVTRACRFLVLAFGIPVAEPADSQGSNCQPRTRCGSPRVSRPEGTRPVCRGRSRCYASCPVTAVYQPSLRRIPSWCATTFLRPVVGRTEKTMSVPTEEEWGDVDQSCNSCQKCRLGIICLGFGISLWRESSPIQKIPLPRVVFFVSSRKNSKTVPAVYASHKARRKWLGRLDSNQHRPH
jgi:hypothetical protein